MEITQNDYGYDVLFTVKDADEQAVPLTDAEEIRFNVVEIDTFRNVLNGLCEVTEAGEGTCKYTVGSGDFKKAGNFQGALLIKFTGGKRITTRKFFITVDRATV